MPHSNLLLALSKRLIDQLVERLALLSGVDAAHDWLSHDVAVLVDHVGGRERVQVGGELSGLAVRLKPDVLIRHALLGKHVLGIGHLVFVAIERKGINAHDLAALLGKLLVELLQIAQLSHARLAGGKPEVHDGDLVLGTARRCLHRCRPSPCP